MDKRSQMKLMIKTTKDNYGIGKFNLSNQLSNFWRIHRGNKRFHKFSTLIHSNNSKKFTGKHEKFWENKLWNKDLRELTASNIWF